MPSRATLLALLLLTAAASTACKREEREARPEPVAERAEGEIVMSGIYPGGEVPPRTSDYPHYDENAYAVSEGKRLYSRLNCVGCHSHGGGGMGPPLMDDTWI